MSLQPYINSQSFDVPWDLVTCWRLLPNPRESTYSDCRWSILNRYFVILRPTDKSRSEPNNWACNTTAWRSRTEYGSPPRTISDSRRKRGSVWAYGWRAGCEHRLGASKGECYWRSKALMKRHGSAIIDQGRKLQIREAEGHGAAIVCEGTCNSWLSISLDGPLVILGFRVDIMQSSQQTAGDWYSMFFGSLYSKLSNGNKYLKSQHLIGLEQESNRHSHGEMTELKQRAVRE